VEHEGKSEREKHVTLSDDVHRVSINVKVLIPLIPETKRYGTGTGSLILL